MGGQQLSHVLGLIFGKDAAGPFKEVADGEAGQLVGRPWLTPAQEASLRVLIPAYGSLPK